MSIFSSTGETKMRRVDNTEVAKNWKDLFERALFYMMSDDLREEDLPNKVKLAASLADLAINAYEERWPK